MSILAYTSSFFFSTIRRHEIRSECFLYSCARNFCCRTIFEVGKVMNVFSRISSSVILSPHNFNCEVILNTLELYSSIVLKSCSLSFIHSLRVFGRIIDFKWLYLSYKPFQRIYRFFIARNSLPSA